MPVSLGSDNIGSSKVLDFVNKDGTINVENLPILDISDIGIYHKLYPEHLANSDSGNENLVESKLNNLDIFSQDFI